MVVVSGPQRSGTHIMALILAQELDWEYIPDNDYNTGDMCDWADKVLTSENSTLHCPHMTHALHLVPPDVAVVYMHRPLGEIESSFARVNPGDVSASRSEQMLFYSQIPGIFEMQTGKRWTEVRNVYWEGYQRLILGGRGFSFYYHALESHPLFVKKEHRKDWEMNQTEPKGENEKE
jgi:hypothetical protein